MRLYSGERLRKGDRLAVHVTVSFDDRDVTGSSNDIFADLEGRSLSVPRKAVVGVVGYAYRVGDPVRLMNDCSGVQQARIEWTDADAALLRLESGALAICSLEEVEPIRDAEDAA